MSIRYVTRDYTFCLWQPVSNQCKHYNYLSQGYWAITGPRAQTQLEPVEDHLHVKNKSLGNLCMHAHWVTPSQTTCLKKIDLKREKNCSELHPRPQTLCRYTGFSSLISQLLNIQFPFQAPAFLQLVFLGPPGANMFLFPVSQESSSVHVALGVF